MYQNMLCCPKIESYVANIKINRAFCQEKMKKSCFFAKKAVLCDICGVFLKMNLIAKVFGKQTDKCNSSKTKTGVIYGYTKCKYRNIKNRL